MPLIRLIAACGLLLSLPGAVAGAPDLAVSAQGRLVTAGAPAQVVSPLGGWTLDISFTRVGWQLSAADLVVTSPAGHRHVLHDVAGTAFLVSDVGRVVAITDVCDGACASRLRVLDLAGAELSARDVAGFSEPVLSSDGAALGFRHVDGVSVLDLTTLATTGYPPLTVFAVGPGGQVAGVRPGAATTLTAFAGRTITLPDAPTRLVLARDGRHVLALGGAALVRADVVTGDVVPLLTGNDGAELRDVRLIGDGLTVGLRRTAGGIVAGELVAMTMDGEIIARTAGPRLAVPVGPSDDRTHEAIPWPLAPNAQHEVGNTYGEYQNYGSAYLHPGIDVMGSPGQPVFAVQAGVVKAILTTSGEYHWRIAIGAAGAGTSEGYLYAHVDQPSIAVNVGQTVTQGQYLGNLVPWPSDDFEHCHFARVRDTGTQWQGLWLCIDNPHRDVPSSEWDWPAFEPASGTDPFAFCTNETSDYQDPDALHGAVDIIAHVGDRIACDWICTVQEIRYTIFPLGHPEQPVVADKLAVRFDMSLDTYTGGPIDPLLVGLFYKQDAVCQTLGDYDDREFFHIVTNSDGDEVYQESDRWQAWDTTTLLDGSYVVRVNVRDVKGNTAAASMTVTTTNGNLPTTVDDGKGGDLVLNCAPNPGPVGTRAIFRLPKAGRATLSVYDLAGRRLRLLVREILAAGPHAAAWDGRDETGALCPAGTYVLRLESPSGIRTEKFALLR